MITISNPSHLALLVLLALFSLAAPAPTRAQHHPAAPHLAPGDWPRAALGQLHALGLLPFDHDPSLWSTDRVEAAALLRAAVARAEWERPEALPVARALLERFVVEYPEAAAREEGVERALAGARPGAAAAGVGYRLGRGEVRTALGVPDGLKAPPAPLPDGHGALATLEASGYVGRFLAGRARVSADGADGARVDALYAVADTRAVGVWAGRRPVGVGLPERGVIVTGAAAVDGAGVDVHAFRLPGFLSHLGTIRGSTSLGRLGRVEQYESPWLWTLRAMLQPHERLTVGLNRGAMVSSPDQEDANWLKQVVFVLVGKHSDELNRHDNQIASVDLVFRPPLGSLPLVAYLEWGLEDSAGAWRDVPGVVFGGYLGALPGVPWLAGGVEHASFAESCCGNPWWYRHRGFDGGWTSDGRPLGHPLGGHGEETRASFDATLARARILLGTDVYSRNRRSENLYYPRWHGPSAGVALTVSALVRPGTLPAPFQLALEAEREEGKGWTRTVIAIRGAILF